MRISLKNWLTAIFLVLGISALYLIIKEYGIKNILNTYKSFDPLILFFYTIAVVIILLLLNLRWDIILKSRNKNIPFRKLFIYRVIGTSINFLTPGPRVGGEPTQASLLTKHNVDFTEGLSTIMIDKIIDITTSGMLFIIGVSLVGLKYSITGSFGWILFFTGIIFIIITITFYYRMLKSKHFFLKIFHILRIDKIKSQMFVELIALIMFDKGILLKM